MHPLCRFVHKVFDITFFINVLHPFKKVGLGQSIHGSSIKRKNCWHPRGLSIWIWGYHGDGDQYVRNTFTEIGWLCVNNLLSRKWRFDLIRFDSTLFGTPTMLDLPLSLEMETEQGYMAKEWYGFDKVIVHPHLMVWATSERGVRALVHLVAFAR